MGAGSITPLFQPIGSSAGNSFSITSQSTTYSAIINDWVVASGASFTITLPTAVGVKNQQIAIQHNGTSLSQVYTLNTTSAQTIGGVASGSYALYTAGETLILMSDNSNWIIVSHYAKSISPITFTPTFGTGYGSATLKSGILIRDGKFGRIRASMVSGAITGADGGISLPSGLTIDTSWLTRVGGSVGSSAGEMVGDWGADGTSTTGKIVTATTTSTSIVYVGGNVANASNLLIASSNIQSSSFGAVSSIPISFDFTVAITQFQP